MGSVVAVDFANRRRPPVEDLPSVPSRVHWIGDHLTAHLGHDEQGRLHLTLSDDCGDPIRVEISDRTAVDALVALADDIAAYLPTRPNAS
ncbi:hypothetical protein [Polymorphospora lycopeni]|uniref:Uncharacterized protein n=1 Tax=Polymorphospora lycopeni TaxID=3140240 RepID=A0ABV5CL85_9ACTN